MIGNSLDGPILQQNVSENWVFHPAGTSWIWGRRSICFISWKRIPFMKGFELQFLLNKTQMYIYNVSMLVYNQRNVPCSRVWSRKKRGDSAFYVERHGKSKNSSHGGNSHSRWRGRIERTEKDFLCRKYPKKNHHINNSGEGLLIGVQKCTPKHKVPS